MDLGDEAADEMDVRRLQRVAHDLRSVVVDIVGIASDLETQAGSSLQPIVRELTTSAELANRLAKLLIAPQATVDEAVSCAPAVVLTFCRAVLDRVAAPFGLVLDVHHTGKIPMPADSLRRVAINLVRRARQGMHRDGSIRVCLHETKLEGRCPPTWAELTISEEGDRVDDSEFQDATPDGLGLTIVHELAAWAGGSLEVEPRPGRGARVRVQLPVLGP